VSCLGVDIAGHVQGFSRRLVAVGEKRSPAKGGIVAVEEHLVSSVELGLRIWGFRLLEV